MIKALIVSLLINIVLVAVLWLIWPEEPDSYDYKTVISEIDKKHKTEILLQGEKHRAEMTELKRDLAKKVFEAKKTSRKIKTTLLAKREKIIKQVKHDDKKLASQISEIADIDSNQIIITKTSVTLTREDSIKWLDVSIKLKNQTIQAQSECRIIIESTLSDFLPKFQKKIHEKERDALDLRQKLQKTRLERDFWRRKSAKAKSGVITTGCVAGAAGLVAGLVAGAVSTAYIIK